MCFLHCADNLFSRELSPEETNCVDKCVIKFSNVNQRLMGAYVRDQGIINERRMKEMEEQAKASEAASLAASLAAAAAAVPAPEPNIATSLESNISTAADSSGEISSQNQSQTLAT